MKTVLIALALTCTSMPPEHPPPRPVRLAAERFFPWVGTGAGEALRAGPVYLVALSSRSRISRDGDARDSAGNYLHRALIAIAPTYRGAVVVAGRSLAFSTDGASSCTVAGNTVMCGSPSLRFASRLRIPPRRGWRIVRTEIRIGRAGCYRVTATGRALAVSVPLSVP